jgi:uncharacterized protein YjbI with pentapeptide repeats
MSKKEGFLAFLLGGFLGAIAMWLQLIYLVENRIYGLYVDDLLYGLAFLLPSVILGGVTAVLIGYFVSRFLIKKYFWLAAILSGIIIQSLTLHAFFFNQYSAQERRLEQRDKEYAIAINWDGQQSMEGFDLFLRDLSGQNLAKANLKGANLSEANLSGANLENADLSRARLNVAKLSKAILIGADLSDAYLFRANLKGADLSGANLSGASLDLVNFTGAVLDGANLSSARYGSETRWPNGFDYQHIGAIGPKASLSEADLNKADLLFVDLSGANLRGADLSEANLEYADLIGTNLENANLSEAILENADLSEAIISGANLSGTKLEEADLNEARYTKETIWPDGYDPVAAGAVLTDGNDNLVEDSE